MIVSETATLAGVEPFRSWNTPICWTGFILFADGVVFRAVGRSWLRSMPGELAALALLSIPLWLVFEFYNLYLANWYYTGLPELRALRLFGYAWSFATIWPAIFEGTELVAILRTGRTAASSPTNDGAAAVYATGAPHPLRSLPTRAAALSIALGASMLALPFVVPSAVARYLAAPVWLGFIFLLDPINAALGAPSLAADVLSGCLDRPTDLVLSGFLCGLLWEFWNFWAGAKWHYTVPILEHVKLFEMPLPGYFGFPAFALECFTMYVFVRTSAGRMRCNFPLGAI